MAEFTAWVLGEIKQGETLKSIHAQVGEAKKGDDVYVNIISEGGSMQEGKDVYNYLKSREFNLYTVAKGTVASIATLIQLAAKKENRYAVKNAEPLIHNPWTETQGDAEAHKLMAQELAKAENELAEIYSMETGTDKDTILAAMKKNDFMSVEEYQSLGFVSQIIEPVKAVAMLDSNTKTNIDQSIMTKIEDKLNRGFKALFNKLGIKNELDATEVKALMLTLQDGSEINVVTEGDSPEVGNEVQTADGSPASDGDYTLADGSVIRVAAGAISEIVEAKMDDDEEVVALKAENETLKAQVSELETKMETYAKMLDTIQAKLEGNYSAPKRKMVTARTIAKTDQPLFTKENLKQTK